MAASPATPCLRERMAKAGAMAWCSFCSEMGRDFSSLDCSYYLGDNGINELFVAGLGAQLYEGE